MTLTTLTTLVPFKALAAGAALLIAHSLAWSQPQPAQTAGEVDFSRGVGFAQTAGQPARTLGKGMVLKEGDKLTTAEGSLAVIKMQDGKSSSSSSSMKKKPLLTTAWSCSSSKAAFGPSPG